MHSNERFELVRYVSGITNLILHNSRGRQTFQTNEVLDVHLHEAGRQTFRCTVPR